MPRLTKEEKAAKLAAAEAEWRKEQAERYAAFRLTVPARMKALVDNINVLGICYHITLVESGPALEIHGHDNIITYDIAEGDMNWVEHWINEKLEYKKYAEARMELAKSAFNKLTNDEKDALKEYIHICR